MFRKNRRDQSVLEVSAQQVEVRDHEVIRAGYDNVCRNCGQVSPSGRCLR